MRRVDDNDLTAADQGSAIASAAEQIIKNAGPELNIGGNRRASLGAPHVHAGLHFGEILHLND